MTEGPTRRPLIPYVRERMAERRITEEAIDWVLEHYDMQFPAEPRRGAKPAVIRQGTYRGRVLKVYVERDTFPLFVKTVTWGD